MLDRAEMALEQREKLGVGAAGEHLGDERTAFGERLDKALRAPLAQIIASAENSALGGNTRFSTITVSICPPVISHLPFYA